MDVKTKENQTSAGVNNLLSGMRPLVVRTQNLKRHEKNEQYIFSVIELCVLYLDRKAMWRDRKMKIMYDVIAD